jgi:hypothetical protein
MAHPALARPPAILPIVPLFGFAGSAAPASVREDDADCLLVFAPHYLRQRSEFRGNSGG